MGTNMGFRAFKEITKWDSPTVPNHTYIFNEKGECIGYKKCGGGYTQFKNPSKQFSKSRRKFIELKPAEKYMVA
jgi:hypothetical protein